ncbi:MAG: LamG domain-containing protein, partial [Cyanobacteria bacterium P01_F01_bin.4]
PLTTISPTTLQFLPNGAQLGILSSPSQYGPSDPTQPKWLLLTLPFLGRLQAPSADGLGLDLSTSETTSSPLQIDPILCLAHQQPSSLALMLATWQTLANGAAARLPISGFDTALGRTWARLDPHSLQESWFRLQHPVTERSPGRLQSVLAATPDSPARLSRATALHQSFDHHRQSVPPDASSPTPARDSAREFTSVSAAQRGLIKTQGFKTPEGLQVLYRFQSGSGTTVADVSNVGDPLDLELSASFDPANRNASAGPHWRWDPDGLVILKPSILTSKGPATQLSDACQRTHELTIEAWLAPTYAQLDQDDFVYKTGPWRIITLSSDRANRNFTLGQGPPKIRNAAQHQPNFYGVRLRSTQTDKNGVRPLQSNAPQPMLVAPRGSLASRLTHVVYTRDAQGVAQLYLDGQAVAKTTVKGDFSNWDDSFHLALANELAPGPVDQQPKNSRPWFGKYYRVALYNRALTADEVQQQTAQGYAGPAQIIPHPWSTSGLHIATSQLAQAEPHLTRYAAATLLPTATTPLDPHPQSLAISPYLGLTFQPAAQGEDNYPLTLISAELLCFDRAMRSLRPIASHLWEVPDPSEASPNPSTEVYTASLRWAHDIHTRLCPESPLAVLRFREIRKLAEDADGSAAPVITGYRYQIVTDLTLTELPLKRVFRLRSEVPHLRFKEGQWGGVALPSELHPFELAPPQTTGAQPIYLSQRPSLNSPPNTEKWPWGLSTLRVSVQPTPTGVVGTLAQKRDRTLWWQAPQYTVQYRSASDLPTAGLPAQFRARAITSLLPTALTPPMPALDTAEIFAIEATPHARWQAILPSTMRYLLLGDRPGVFFNLRNQLLRQGDLKPTGQPTGQPHGSVFVSGSVPVQHRMPRPVPLPPNPASQLDNSSALQPWASYFEPAQTVLVTEAPADEAFFGAAQLKPARRLQMRLITPRRGAIPIDWNGQLQFEVLGNAGSDSTPMPLEAWDIEVVAIANNQTLPYTLSNTVVEPPSIPSKQTYAPVNSDALKNQLALLSAGATLTIQARVKPTATTDGFRQILSFELRAISDRTLPLPLSPQFLQFEDPEYNRQLASPTAHASTQIALLLLPGSQPELIPLRLATDRREYNPDSVLAWRYDWANPTADGPFQKREFELKRLRAGVETRLSIPSKTLQTMTVQTGQLNQIPLAELLLGSTAASADSTAVLQPNDTLQLSLQLFKTTADTAPEKVLVLGVTIVAEPVHPSPEAAYGLLRQNLDGSVECVRFAWGTMPNRVDLINPEDLRTEVTRRQALFRWTDTKRAQHSVKYAIQKITQTGSTALPNFESDFENEIRDHTAQ